VASHGTYSPLVNPSETFDDSFFQPEDIVFRLFDQKGKLLALAKPGPSPHSFLPFLVIH